MAKIIPVWIYFTRKTLPNFPSPSLVINLKFYLFTLFLYVDNRHMLYSEQIDFNFLFILFFINGGEGALKVIRKF